MSEIEWDWTFLNSIDPGNLIPLNEIGDGEDVIETIDLGRKTDGFYLVYWKKGEEHRWEGPFRTVQEAIDRFEHGDTQEIADLRARLATVEAERDTYRCELSNAADSLGRVMSERDRALGEEAVLREALQRHHDFTTLDVPKYVAKYPDGADDEIDEDTSLQRVSANALAATPLAALAGAVIACAERLGTHVSHQTTGPYLVVLYGLPKDFEGVVKVPDEGAKLVADLLAAVDALRAARTAAAGGTDG
jgi:hypothetical protein